MTLNLLFHVHTNASFDSMMSPHTILRFCRDNGIHAVAICDHDTVRGAIEAQEAADEYGVIVIPAVEISTNAGDIIGLFADKTPRTDDVQSVIDFIHDECRGLAVLPHPARSHDLDRIPFEQIDIIETGNSRCTAADNRLAEDLAGKYGKPALVGADAHVAGELPGALNTFDLHTLDDACLTGQTNTPSAEQLRRMILTAPRQLEIQRSPIRFAAMSRAIKGFKRRQPITILRACRTLLREEAHRRLWRFHRKAASK